MGENLNTKKNPKQKKRKKETETTRKEMAMNKTNDVDDDK